MIKIPLNANIISQAVKLNLNMAFRRQDDDDPPLNAGFVSL